MKKLESLVAWLKRSVPALKQDPENLIAYVEKGRMVCRPGPTLAFEYRYTVALGVLDLAGSIDTVTVPLLAWIAANEPELIDSPTRNRDGLGFELERIDTDKSDLVVRVELSERVLVARRTDGGMDVTHLAEPEVDDEFDPPLPEGTHLWKVLLGDDVLFDATPAP